jgi:hypothetical protein
LVDQRSVIYEKLYMCQRSPRFWAALDFRITGRLRRLAVLAVLVFAFPTVMLCPPEPLQVLRKAPECRDLLTPHRFSLLEPLVASARPCLRHLRHDDAEDGADDGDDRWPDGGHG